MASANGQSGRDVGQERLLQLMKEEPYSFRFFQMIRLMGRLYPDRKPVGIFATPSDELVRFSALPSLTFPASEIQSYAPQNDQPERLEVNFMGLNVVNGPMPRSYTAALLERKRAKDKATIEFFDVFNHRIVSLFYRAWKKYRFFIAYESRAEGDDEITQRLYDIVGLGTPGMRNRMAIPDEAAIYYAGILGNQVRSAEGLKQVLEHYFRVPVEIRQFTGGWERLPASQQTFLREAGSFSECLGMGTVVGDEVWNQQGALTVRLGPMPLERYRQFLPGAPGQKELEAWLMFYSRRQFDFVVQLVLAREEVPHTVLVSEESPRLGYESWLKVKPFHRDPDETTYVLH
ncbi:MAG TPA: type VI secretion system baseplate subunit TssG [Acidobacteriaceae bacterium]